jgi:hypothetical protein
LVEYIHWFTFSGMNKNKDEEKIYENIISYINKEELIEIPNYVNKNWYKVIKNKKNICNLNDYIEIKFPKYETIFIGSTFHESKNKKIKPKKR